MFLLVLQTASDTSGCTVDSQKLRPWKDGPQEKESWVPVQALDTNRDQIHNNPFLSPTSSLQWRRIESPQHNSQPV